jgi:uncharacterized protein YndB with AHSA1/START domain
MPTPSSIVTTTTIHAPIERVWEFVCDASRYDEWVADTLQVLRADSPLVLGSTYEELTRIAGPWKAKTRWRVTEFEPPRRQVHAGEGVAIATDMTVAIELLPAGDETQYTLTVRYTPKFGVVGAIVDAAVRGTIKRSQQRSAEVLARLVGTGV